MFRGRTLQTALVSLMDCTNSYKHACLFFVPQIQYTKRETSQFSFDIEATRVFTDRYLLPLCVMRVTVSQGRLVQDGLCVSWQHGFGTQGILKTVPLGEQWASIVMESKMFSASRYVQPFDIVTCQSLLTAKSQAPQWSHEVRQKESLMF